MKNTLLFLILLASITISFAQVAMTFKNAEAKGKSFRHLDSLYKSAVHIDVNLTVFKSQEEQAELQKAYVGLVKDLAAFLKSNNFKWEKPTRCFNRIYFNSNGTIDYFLYNFSADQIVPEKEKEFDRLLNLFIKNYRFSLNAKERFAQCSPIKYTDL
jgi:hypothetical protein